MADDLDAIPAELLELLRTLHDPSKSRKTKTSDLKGIDSTNRLQRSRLVSRSANQQSSSAHIVTDKFYGSTKMFVRLEYCAQ